MRHPSCRNRRCRWGWWDIHHGLRVFGRMHYPEGRRPVIGETLRVVIDASAPTPIYAFEPEAQ